MAVVLIRVGKSGNSTVAPASLKNRQVFHNTLQLPYIARERVVQQLSSRASPKTKRLVA